MSDLIYTYPNMFVGEVFTWKGYVWRVQAWNPMGGEVKLVDEAGKETNAVATNGVLVLELVKPTDRKTKVAKAVRKRMRKQRRRFTAPM